MLTVDAENVAKDDLGDVVSRICRGGQSRRIGLNKRYERYTTHFCKPPNLTLHLVFWPYELAVADRNPRIRHALARSSVWLDDGIVKQLRRDSEFVVRAAVCEHPQFLLRALHKFWFASAFGFGHQLPNPGCMWGC
jgi:hypothetical protein